MKKILILNRWTDCFSEYHRYIDHKKNAVAYICMTDSDKHLRSALTVHIETTADFSDKSLLQKAKKIKNKLGGVDHIIALSEFDLLPASRLREKLNVAGASTSETMKFRNKILMKAMIVAKGILAPRFVIPEPSLLKKLTNRVGYPIILKPQFGAASQGVIKVDNEKSLYESLNHIDKDTYQCEQYIDGKIYHLDGVIRNEEMLFCKASYYINSCYDFLHGTPLGSVIVTNLTKVKQLNNFTIECLKALELQNGVFHIEIIEDKKGELYFLEVGKRVGGGEILFVIQDLCGVDLVAEAIAAELCQPSTINKKRTGVGKAGGFLMIPSPKHVPCRVLDCSSLINRIDSLYHESLAKVGQVFRESIGYSHMSGSFRFQGSHEKKIDLDIRQAIKEFKIKTEGV